MSHYNRGIFPDRFNEIFIKPTNYVLITGADEPAIDLSIVKQHLNFPINEQVPNLLLMVNTATTRGEKLTGRDFINKTYKTYLDCFPCGDTRIKILKSKLQSITIIQYYKDGILTTFDSSNYHITDNSDYAFICLLPDKEWPLDSDDRCQSVEITFVAGYGSDCDSMPDLIQRALLADISSLFENKGDCSDCDSSDVSQQALSLYRPCRIAETLVIGI